jgi:protein gp37
MGETTEIAWTDATFNPWIGCTKVSPGCANCYAAAQDARWGHDRWGKGKPRGRTSPANWRKPLAWNAKAERLAFEAMQLKRPVMRPRVFCASLADVFDPEVPREWRLDLFELIEKTPALDWLVLTKRPEGFADFFGGESGAGEAAPMLPNLWLGVTAENQAEAERRIPLLLMQPAVVRFVSAEPLLGPLDLSKWIWPMCWSWDARFRTPEAARAAGARAELKRQSLVSAHARFIDWCIVGGESRQNFGQPRPFDVAWARNLVEQCRGAGVAPFVKQLGAAPFDSVQVDPPYITLNDKRAGANPDEWPEDLRVREFPQVRR